MHNSIDQQELCISAFYVSTQTIRSVETGGNGAGSKTPGERSRRKKFPRGIFLNAVGQFSLFLIYHVPGGPFNGIHA